MAPRSLIIALVGRPYVGKSTLFNRFLGTRKAVVASARRPERSRTDGTTRDRLEGRTVWQGVSLTFIDTGGVEFGASDALTAAVQRHVHHAVAQADVAVLVCDGPQGVVPADVMLVEQLRKAGKPMVLAVNKLENRMSPPWEFYSLGLEPVCAISALHGLGTDDLLERIVASSPALEQAPNGSADRPPSTARCAIAIIGRQNVGKSSLLNALLKEERVIVNERAGTTRDAIDTELNVEGAPVTLIDTAGLRHRRKVRSPVDLFAMARSLATIRRCDVALVVLDGTQGVTQDDRRIVAQVCEAGRGLILLVNKWDLVKGASERSLAARMAQQLPAAAFAPVLAVSARTGLGVHQSVRIALRVCRAMRQGPSDEALLTLLQRAGAGIPLPRLRGRRLSLQRAHWRPGPPVRLELTITPRGKLPMPYERYLIKCLQRQPRWAGIPLTVHVVRVASPTEAAGVPGLGRRTRHNRHAER